MLHLGDVVRIPGTNSEPSQTDIIDQVFEIDGECYYRTNNSTKTFTEAELELVRSAHLYQQYDIGDIFITDRHKDECDYLGITDNMVSGTTAAMEIRISSVFLTREGRIVYSYYVDTPIGTLEGIIRPSDALKHQYTLF